MRRVCVFCEKEIDSTGTGPEAPITRGICADCASRNASQRETPLREYLDSIPAPVVLVDSERKVRIANRYASEYLGKDIAEAEGFTGGEVFECENARLPGGCGHTVHCSGCAIRKAVLDTLILDKNCVRMPAYLNRKTFRRTQRLELLISTEKVHGMVLLRIDEIRDEDGAPLTNLNDNR